MANNDTVIGANCGVPRFLSNEDPKRRLKLSIEAGVGETHKWIHSRFKDAFPWLYGMTGDNLQSGGFFSPPPYAWPGVDPEVTIDTLVERWLFPVTSVEVTGNWTPTGQRAVQVSHSGHTAELFHPPEDKRELRFELSVDDGPWTSLSPHATQTAGAFGGGQPAVESVSFAGALPVGTHGRVRVSDGRIAMDGHFHAFYRVESAQFNILTTSLAPDLVPQSLTVSPTSGPAGSPATVDFTIHNNGTAASSACTAHIRIAGSSVNVTTSDPLLAGLSVPPIPAGLSHHVLAQPVQIPAAAAGSYTATGTNYLWVIVDVDNEAGQITTANDRARTAVTMTGGSGGQPGSFLLTSAGPYCNTTPPVGPAVLLTWSASSGASSYRVFRGTTPSSIPAYSGSLAASQLTFDNNANVVAGQTYYYFVRATNANGSTDTPTQTVNVAGNVCGSSSTTPGAFSLTSAVPYCNTTPPVGPAVLLTWSASSGASSYRVFRGTTPSSIPAYSGSLAASQLTFDNNANVIAGQTYYYFVRATNGNGSTDTSTQAVNVPGNVCGAPTTIGPGSTTQGSGPAVGLTPAMSWNAVNAMPTAMSYQFYISMLGGTSYNLIYTSPIIQGTSFPVPAGLLSFGNSYRWNMVCLSGAYTSPYSARRYFHP